MAKFNYEARTRDGAIVKGSINVKNKRDAVDSLIAKGLVVVNIYEDAGLNLDAFQQVNIGGVPIKERVLFMRQLATMINAGLTMPQSLRILKTQIKNPYFKKAIDQVLFDVEGGMSFSRALGKTKNIFDEITISLISAGEESGNMDLILSRLATELEKKKALQDKIRGAMIYPAIMVVLIIGVIVLLILVLIPAMKDIYQTLGVDKLPPITTFFVFLSDWFIKYWWALIIIVAFVVAIVKAYIDSKPGKRFLNIFFLKMPVFGKLITYMQLSQFSRVLGLLMKGGLSISESLRLTANSLSNLVFKEAVLSAKIEVEKGTSLSLPIARVKEFPLLVSQMILVGEETGALDEVLEKLATMYEEEVNNMTSNLSTLMEPLILVIMGGAVALIAAAVYLPMFNLAANFSA